MEHVKLVNGELLPLADQLNLIINSMQQLDPFHQASQQLEQWREMSHRKTATTDRSSTENR